MSFGPQEYLERILPRKISFANMGNSYASDTELRSNIHGQQRRVKCIDYKVHIQLAIPTRTLKTRRTYRLRDHFPLFARLYHIHYHIQFSARSSSHDDASEIVETEFPQMFKHGSGVAEAY
uniref:Uncharacterized protein n=1 Tax=Spongospora subterranea TaxID=70186 RepID=A0A0H5QIS8_9EUKA|eukprot:CRZ01898.1 hypothetical protein [Spongospora subterranea]